MVVAPINSVSAEVDGLTKFLKVSKKMDNSIVLNQATSTTAALKSGSLITLAYEGREFDVVVIDPNGLGKGQPSVGFGFRMADRYIGTPQPTLSGWVIGKDGDKCLKVPSGKSFRVIDILASDNNTYSVVEASDWFAIAIDLLLTPGKTGKATRARLGDFLRWFAVKGFYAEAYVAFKGVYTGKDSRATTQWLEARQSGIPTRKLYTDLLQAEGCSTYDYGNWTNKIYHGLFGKPAKKMIAEWELIAGSAKVARNYVPEALGLDAVRYCEDMAVRMFVDNLEEAHDAAINLTKRKYNLDAVRAIA
jgi:hypothetical protein